VEKANIGDRFGHRVALAHRLSAKLRHSVNFSLTETEAQG